MAENTPQKQNFNMHIFMGIYGTQEFNSASIGVIYSEDDLTCVLKLHLLTERLLEAWICGCTEVDIFSTEHDVRFTPSYSTKLALAARLGFPKPAFEALDKFNKLRNEFAHKLSTNDIEMRYLESMFTHIERMPLGPDMQQIKDMKFGTYNSDESIKNEYIYTDKETPPRIKLILIYTSLTQRIFYHITQHTNVFSKSGHPVADKYPTKF